MTTTERSLGVLKATSGFLKRTYLSLPDQHLRSSEVQSVSHLPVKRLSATHMTFTGSNAGAVALLAIKLLRKLIGVRSTLAVRSQAA